MEGPNSDMMLAVGDHMFWPPVSSHVTAQKRRNLARPLSPDAPAFVCGQTCRNTPGLADQHLMFFLFFLGGGGAEGVHDLTGFCQFISI